MFNNACTKMMTCKEEDEERVAYYKHNDRKN